MIKIPRMHFKYLERLEYEGIMEQAREIEEGRKKGRQDAGSNNALKDTKLAVDSMASFYATPLASHLAQKHQLNMAML